jgi:ABC-type dipeptide/oligopeptide/nickel transport system permease component
VAFGRFIIQRILYLVLQLIGVITITFFFVHLLPGNPAQALAGAGASPSSVAAIERELGLDKPLPEQYLIYVGNLLHGDLGTSIYTGHAVIADLNQRVPATLELVILSMTLVVGVGIPLGVYSGLQQKGVGSRSIFVYGMLTGAIPDFWVGIVLIYLLFFLLAWAPAPLGQFGIGEPPIHRTGLFLIDSLLAGDVGAFVTTLQYLWLPVVTLVVSHMPNVVKQARASVVQVIRSEFIEFARASGLPERVVLRYMLRNALAPVVATVAIVAGFLFGGAVLVETVFSWGGVGQYAVQSISNSDYAPITGFVLVAALYMAVMYLVVDVVYALLDPRIRLAK